MTENRILYRSNEHRQNNTTRRYRFFYFIYFIIRVCTWKKPNENGGKNEPEHGRTIETETLICSLKIRKKKKNRNFDTIKTIFGHETNIFNEIET